jgi:SM-20-related protein
VSSGQVEIVELAIGAPPRRLLIVDNFLEPDAARAIFDHVRDLSYTLSDSDRADTADYLHFKHDFEIGRDRGDPLMLLLADRARVLMGSRGIACGPIFRIYANLNMFGDFQFAHCDGDGWTALLLANPEWDEDWGGEFIVYGGDGRPYDYAIRPRAGRMLIFDGLIPHRGGVPSKFCHEPRISIAIKFERL